MGTHWTLMKSWKAQCGTHKVFAFPKPNTRPRFVTYGTSYIFLKLENFILKSPKAI
jgi:hypothetical protein